MSDGFLAFKTHSACKVHYLSDYDAFFYKFKTKVSEYQFKKSPLRWQYQAFEKQMCGNVNAMAWYFYYVYQNYPFRFHNKPFNPEFVKESEAEIRHLFEFKNSITPSVVDFLSEFEGIYPRAYQMMLKKKISYNEILVLEITGKVLNKSKSGVSDPFAFPKFLKKMGKDLGFVNLAINHLIS